MLHLHYQGYTYFLQNLNNQVKNTFLIQLHDQRNQSFLLKSITASYMIKVIIYFNFIYLIISITPSYFICKIKVIHPF